MVRRKIIKKTIYLDAFDILFLIVYVQGESWKALQGDCKAIQGDCKALQGDCKAIQGDLRAKMQNCFLINM